MQVQLRDHHCPYIDNCVGKANLASFTFFVLCFDVLVWCEVADMSWALNNVYAEVFDQLPWYMVLVSLLVFAVGVYFVVLFTISIFVLVCAPSLPLSLY